MEYYEKWKVLDIGFCFALIVVATFLVLGVDTWLLKKSELPFLILFDFIGAFSVYFIFFKRYKISFSQVYKTKLLLLLPLFLVLQFLFTVVRVGLANGFSDLTLLYRNLGFLNLEDLRIISLDYVTGIFLAPIWEEVLFRGVIFLILLRKFGSKIAILVPSLFFALLHIDPNFLSNWPATLLSTMLLIFIESVFKSYVVYKTKSVTVPTIMHIFGNIISTFILLIYDKLGLT